MQIGQLKEIRKIQWYWWPVSYTHLENNRINSKKYNLVEEKRPGKYFPVYEDERGTFLFNTEDLCMIEMCIRDRVKIVYQVF